MKNQFVLFILFFPWFVAGQTKSDLKILHTEQQRFEAMEQRDTIRLRQLLADNLFYLHSNAFSEDKSAHISAIAAGRLIYKKMLREQASVRRYGRTALVNGIVFVTGVLNGNPFEVRLAYSAIYRKKSGRWQLLNWQSTRIP